MNITILVATHKPYDNFPKEDIYKKCEVGASSRTKHFGDFLDNGGKDNISDKNFSYCELTALYWAWKNLDYDILGLCHYRRYFSRKKFLLFDNLNSVLTKKDILKFLSTNDFILPKATKMKYSNYDHSRACYDDHHMDITRDVISEIYPEYLESFDKIMQQQGGHFLNMFIAKKEIINGYFQWLFSILFEVEKRYKFDCPDPRSTRVFGYISENMLDVYIDKNGFSYVEKPVIYLERPALFKRIIGRLSKR